MAQKTYYLAVDIGASSGRHILGHLENGRLVTEEIHRFPNGLEKKDGERSAALALELYESKRISDAFRLEGLIWEMLSGFAEAEDLHEFPGQNCSELIQRFFFLAQNPVSASSHIRELAGQLHVSESTLSKRFRAETGMTPGSYLSRLVLDRACRMLLS